MTTEAIRGFEELTGEQGCENALASPDELLAVSGREVAVAEVLSTLDDATLSGTPEDKELSIDLPEQTEVHVRLVRGTLGWRIDGILVGQTVTCGPGDAVGSGPGC